jgi:hypothetical protein
MKDGQLRGIVLEKFYELRNQQPGMLDVLSLPESVSLDPNANRLLTFVINSERTGLFGGGR